MIGLFIEDKGGYLPFNRCFLIKKLINYIFIMVFIYNDSFLSQLFDVWKWVQFITSGLLLNFPVWLQGKWWLMIHTIVLSCGMLTSKDRKLINMCHSKKPSFQEISIYLAKIIQPASETPKVLVNKIVMFSRLLFMLILL